MPKFRMSKSSSSTSKGGARAGRTRQKKRKRAKAGKPKFSILKFKFAVPSSLNNLLRLAAGVALLAQVSVQAGPGSGSLWKEDASASSMFADKRAQAAGDLITIIAQESNTSSKENRTQTSKSSSVDASIDTFLYSPTASAQIIGGALVEREIPTEIVRDNAIELLHEPDSTSSARLATAINEKYTNSCEAVDSTTVQVKIPAGLRNSDREGCLQSEFARSDAARHDGHSSGDEASRCASC